MRELSADLPWFSPWYVEPGPLIVLPRALVPYWSGGDTPHDDRVIRADEPGTILYGTDLARAVEVAADRWTAALEVGPGFGIVIYHGGDAMCGARWLRLSDAPGAFVIIPSPDGDYKEQLDQWVIAELKQRPEPEWRTVCTSFSVGDGGLLLMHAADSWADGLFEMDEVESGDAAVLGQVIPCPLREGVYVVEERKVTVPGQQAPLVIGCRFRPASPFDGG